MIVKPREPVTSSAEKTKQIRSSTRIKFPLIVSTLWTTWSYAQHYFNGAFQSRQMSALPLLTRQSTLFAFLPMTLTAYSVPTSAETIWRM